MKNETYEVHHDTEGGGTLVKKFADLEAAKAYAADKVYRGGPAQITTVIGGPVKDEPAYPPAKRDPTFDPPPKEKIEKEMKEWEKPAPKRKTPTGKKDR